MLKVGMSSGHPKIAFGVDDSLRLLSEAGFKGVDYSLCAYDEGEDYIFLQSDEKIKEHFLHIKEVAEKLDLEICQTHAPLFYGGGLRGENPDVVLADKMIKIFENSIKATKFLGCKYIVAHPWIMDDYDNVFFENLELNIKFFNKLKPILNETGVIMAIENMDGINAFNNRPGPTPFSSAEKINYLLKHLGEGFCACLDTGHSFLAGNDPAKAIKRLGSNLKVLHLQDCDGMDDIHVIPTCANIDWDSVCKALAEINYDGLINFEVNIFRTTHKWDTMLAECKFLNEIGKEFIEKIEKHKKEFTYEG